MKMIYTIKMKKTPAIEADLLLVGKEVQIVKASMQLPILQASVKEHCKKGHIPKTTNHK